MKVSKVFKLAMVAVLAVALSGVSAGPSAASSPTSKLTRLIVSTDKGRVQGAVADGVENFLGIPYAAPPVGKLRWQPPQPAQKWKGVRAAQHYGNACPQTASLDSPLVDNEDCLFVNVQRPIDIAAHQKLPVIVYIHGGGFTGGSGENLNKIVHDTGVIGVSMNYRLGALGFLDLPGLSQGKDGSGNYGIQDQQAALRWVQANIAHFGGDPRRVTIDGESVGGGSVCFQLLSPSSRGLFSQAMMQSGYCRASTQAQGEQQGAATAAQLGCLDAATAPTCLRSKSTDQLLQLGFRPSVIFGTPLIPVDPQIAVKIGQFTRVPTVVGGQRDEGRSFSQGSIGWSKLQYTSWLDTNFGVNSKTVLAHYPWPAHADTFTATYLVGAIQTDSGNATGLRGTINQGIGGCGTQRLTQNISRYTRTYSYEFDHRTGPGWTDVPGFVWGAGHATEVNYLFPLHDITTESEYHQFGPAEKRLADEMVQYWGAFVKNGSPGVWGQQWWPHYATQDLGLTLSLRAGTDGYTTLITDQTYSAEHQCDLWNKLAA